MQSLQFPKTKQSFKDIDTEEEYDIYDINESCKESIQTPISNEHDKKQKDLQKELNLAEIQESIDLMKSYTSP